MKHFAGHALMKHCIKIFSILYSIGIIGQDIAIGTWRTHFSYSNARILATNADKVFCAVENGLFSYTLNSGEIRKLSKLDGLSDAGISAMNYSPNANVLVIGYREGLIDFIYENEIVTIRDIANSNLEGDKRINDIAVNQNLAYMATALGVIVIDLPSSEIIENYIQIGAGGDQVVVSEIIVRNDSLFILTDQGVQSGSLGKNLLDFNNWRRYPNTSLYTDLTIGNQKLYAVDGNGGVALFQDEAWVEGFLALPEGADQLFELANDIYTVANGQIFQLVNGIFELRLSTNLPSINDLLLIDGELFIADGVVGLTDDEGMRIPIQGPITDSYSNLKVLSTEVFAFHAPSAISYDGTQKIAGYSYFNEGGWTNPVIEGFENISDVSDFNGTRYFASIGDGLFNSNTQEVIIDIPDSGSELDSIIAVLGSRDQLWVGGSGNEPIHSFNSDGSWFSYEAAQVFDDGFLAIEIAFSGVAWLTSSGGNITVIDPEAEEIEELSRSDGLPSTVNDFNISIEDNVWAVTDRGPAFFPSASFIFSETQAIQPTFENRLLFEDEVINAVLTDGGNRVWFGTDRGLWVFDESTSEQVAVFNESNSPIPSDVILDLAYNGKNGEVFIITDKGMVSYRSSSSIGNRDHRNVSVFPNPVGPGYDGLVGINGLARNVSLKITDISGNLVQEVFSNGGTASWDLLDQRGSMVVTGVYYFFSATSDGEETYIGKVAVVR